MDRIEEGWAETDNGSWICIEGGEVSATVFWKAASAFNEAGWCAVANTADGPRFLVDTYPDADAAMSAADSGDPSVWTRPRPPPPRDWQPAKKGGGLWRHSPTGGVVAIKQARSGSWFCTRMGEAMLGDAVTRQALWFASRDEAQSAAEELAAAPTMGMRPCRYAWFERQD